MLLQYLERLLGCPHKHLSFPVLTEQDRRQLGPTALPHVTCLDCGREYWYDWQRMKQSRERPLQPVAHIAELPSDRAA